MASPDRGARTQFAAALALDLVGAGAALLIAARTWQTVLTPRPRPLTDDVLELTGRTIDSAPTALALVALAGVVAVLATRGLGRRVIGVVMAAAGAALLWQSLTGLSAISASRARAYVQSKHSGVGVDAHVLPQLTVHVWWPALSAGCGVLVAVAGLLIAARGHRWVGMSARYEAPGSAVEVDGETVRTRESLALWKALDRGDDPTGGDGPGRATSGR